MRRGSLAKTWAALRQPRAKWSGTLSRRLRERLDRLGHCLHALGIARAGDVLIHLSGECSERVATRASVLLLGRVECRTDCRRALTRQPVPAHQLVQVGA